jgi:hypothetical protein
MTMIQPVAREYRTGALDSRRWGRYVPRPGDTAIATAPKWGTTWRQQIVSSLVFQEAAARAAWPGAGAARFGYGPVPRFG